MPNVLLSKTTHPKHFVRMNARVEFELDLFHNQLNNYDKAMFPEVHEMPQGAVSYFDHSKKFVHNAQQFEKR
jgi:hypothetical protein